MPLLYILIALAAVVLFTYSRFHQAVPRHYEHARRSSGRERGESARRTHETRAEMLAACQATGTACRSEYFHAWSRPRNGSCQVRMEDGYPVPDPRCTPGGFNPSIGVATLQNPAWRTGCVRNCQTSEQEKHIAYGWYGVKKPRRNYGSRQVCELDHLVPLELGGADGLGNIWPQCGPDGVALDQRYFKMKDRVEDYLAEEVRTGKMPLRAAQRGIAEDWVRYLPAASQYCKTHGRC
jgi:hypothetical protein